MRQRETCAPHRVCGQLPPREQSREKKRRLRNFEMGGTTTLCENERAVLDDRARSLTGE